MSNTHDPRPLQTLPLNESRVRFDWQRAEVEKRRAQLESDTFVGPDGELRWTSNPTSVIPMDVFRDAYVAAPAAQQAAYDTNTTAFLREYRARMANHVPSAEELFEMRAAFGPGATVVNAITGQEYHL